VRSIDRDHLLAFPLSRMQIPDIGRVGAYDRHRTNTRLLTADGIINLKIEDDEKGPRTVERYCPRKIWPRFRSLNG